MRRGRFPVLLARSGLDGASLHTLRHSAASALIASGIHVRIVQEVLGHSTYAVTADTYAHIAVTQQREAAERLGQAFQW
jgi:site-specific recombinase XerD